MLKILNGVLINTRSYTKQTINPKQTNSIMPRPRTLVRRGQLAFSTNPLRSITAKRLIISVKYHMISYKILVENVIDVKTHENQCEFNKIISHE